MSPLPKPMPFILCGRRAEIGKVVSKLLAPEFEGIHFITTNEAALTDIPRLLKGEKPESPDESGVGTQNYSQVPRAVVFGRGYSFAEVEQFRKASEGCNAKPVVWFTGDPNKKPGPNDPPPGPGYAQAAANSLKEKLIAWRDEGGIHDGISLW
ncbi:hypothetical protein F1880_003724 [Penicillium rolfsii]|nr:hypothetical protein F1880_003724 [Penicillium rolfsii]